MLPSAARRMDTTQFSTHLLEVLCWMVTLVDSVRRGIQPQQLCEPLATPVAYEAFSREQRHGIQPARAALSSNQARLVRQIPTELSKFTSCPFFKLRRLLEDYSAFQWLEGRTKCARAGKIHWRTLGSLRYLPSLSLAGGAFLPDLVSGLLLFCCACRKDANGNRKSSVSASVACTPCCSSTPTLPHHCLGRRKKTFPA